MQHEGSLKIYVKLYEQNFIRKGIAERIQSFWDHPNSINPAKTETCLDEIDNVYLMVSLHAEQKCRLVLTRKVPYVPDDIQTFGHEI